MSQSKLIELSYFDPAQGVRLTAYADTIVTESDGKHKTTSAIRFGGYPEMVRGMADAIYGGATIEAIQNGTTISLESRLKSYRRQMSHDGLYATATLMASDDMQAADASEDSEEETAGEQAADETQDAQAASGVLTGHRKGTSGGAAPGGRTAAAGSTIDRLRVVNKCTLAGGYKEKGLSRSSSNVPTSVLSLWSITAFPVYAILPQMSIQSM